MTALATIFALLPMALGMTGGGGFISQPLAIVVIGGLISSTLLTLVLVPTLYTMVESRKEKIRASVRATPRAAHRREPRGAGSCFRRASMTNTTRGRGVLRDFQPSKLPHPTVEIVIPVYNEERGARGVRRRLHAYLGERLPVPVADHRGRQRERPTGPGTSPDGLAARARPDVQRRPPRPQGPRAARCARRGRPATADVVVYMDVDLSTDLDALLPLVAPLVVGPLRPRHRHPPGRGARVVRGPQARAHLPQLQPHPPAVLAHALPRRPVRLQGGARRRGAGPAARRSRTTPGSSTPSCCCSPSTTGCASTRSRSTGSTIPTRGSTSSAPPSTTCAECGGWPA